MGIYVNVVEAPEVTGDQVAGGRVKDGTMGIDKTNSWL